MGRKIKNMLSKLPGSKQFLTGLARIRINKERLNKRHNYVHDAFTLPEGIKEPLVSIIILNRDGRDKLKILMNSLYKCQFYERFEIIFVDNASTDNSVTYMESWKKEFSITIVQNKENETFSVANNIGVKYSKGEYLLFLNNDTEVTDGWMDELLKVIYSKERAGAIGARLVYPKIPKNEKNSGKSYKIQHAGIGFQDKIREKQYFIQPYNLGNGRFVYGEKTGAIERACVAAAVLLMTRKAFDEVGGFDEQYIYEYEDVDLCLKLGKAGYHNYYCADCLVYHYEFGTQNKDDASDVKKRRRHNMEVFKGKWQRYLSRKILEEKIEKRHIFMEAKLTICIVKPEAGLLPGIAEYAEALKKTGYLVRYLGQDDEKRYNIGIGTDVLLSFDADYDITKIANVKNDLLKLTPPEIPENVQDFIEMLYDYSRDVVCGNEIDICGAMPENDTKKFWGDYHYAMALKKEFEKRGYRANVLPRERWYDRSSAKYVLVLRGVKPYYPGVEDGRKIIMWNISHPADVSIEEYNLFDFVFFASEYMKRMVGPKIIPASEVLLQCVDDEVMTCKEHEEKKYELLFVGNSRGIFRPILKDLLPTLYRLTVYGRHWEEFPVKEYVVQEYLDNAKVGQAYHDAMILLNDHWDDMREYGIISNRIFDALAVGAFIISDDVPELEKVLQGSVVTYKNKDDLHEKIDYYMIHEKERNEKALLGKELVLKNHTFAHRVDKLLEIMETL